MTEEQSANESSSSEPSENVKTVSLHDVGKARVICQHELNPSVDLVYLCVMTLTLEVFALLDCLCAVLMPFHFCALLGCFMDFLLLFALLAK
ncbi:MAG: hypothetical protein IPP57_23335 [Candidatus Obscuribacter sp.]|nr:hypothetical protein [Candidatus Obscuribacter sp.]